MMLFTFSSSEYIRFKYEQQKPTLNYDVLSKGFLQNVQLHIIGFRGGVSMRWITRAVGFYFDLRFLLLFIFA